MWWGHAPLQRRWVRSPESGIFFNSTIPHYGPGGYLSVESYSLISIGSLNSHCQPGELNALKAAAPPLLIPYKSRLDLELDHLDDFRMQKWDNFSRFEMNRMKYPGTVTGPRNRVIYDVPYSPVL